MYELLEHVHVDLGTGSSCALMKADFIFVTFVQLSMAQLHQQQQQVAAVPASVQRSHAVLNASDVCTDGDQASVTSRKMLTCP